MRGATPLPDDLLKLPTPARMRVQGRSWLQQSLKALNRELTVAEDFVQQPGAERLARMCGHHRAPPILVT